MENDGVLRWINFFEFTRTDSAEIIDLLIYLMLNLLTVYIVVRWFYLKSPDNKHYSFSYFTVSTVIFLLVFLLDNVRFELSLALGLFAIFGVIRYRTDPIPMKEITYLFVIIGISVINAITNSHISFFQLLLVNGIIILSVGLMESDLIFQRELRKKIRYDRIEMIVPERRQELIEDLEKRTGLRISQIDIGNIDLLRDTAEITIFYRQEENKSEVLT